MAMKTLTSLLAMLLVSTSALATEVGVSIEVGEPGFYGRIDLGAAPRPELAQALRQLPCVRTPGLFRAGRLVPRRLQPVLPQAPRQERRPRQGQARQGVMT